MSFFSILNGTGELVLPPRSEKVTESTAQCFQVFHIWQCQPRSLRFDVGSKYVSSPSTRIHTDETLLHHHLLSFLSYLALYHKLLLL